MKRKKRSGQSRSAIKVKNVKKKNPYSTPTALTSYRSHHPASAAARLGSIACTRPRRLCPVPHARAWTHLPPPLPKPVTAHLPAALTRARPGNAAQGRAAWLTGVDKLLSRTPGFPERILPRSSKGHLTSTRFSAQHLHPPPHMGSFCPDITAEVGAIGPERSPSTELSHPSTPASTSAWPSARRRAWESAGSPWPLPPPGLRWCSVRMPSPPPRRTCTITCPSLPNHCPGLRNLIRSSKTKANQSQAKTPKSVFWFPVFLPLPTRFSAPFRTTLPVVVKLVWSTTPERIEKNRVF